MKKWIIPCNVNFYDVIGAFDEFDTLFWKQSVNINKGDIVYIYVGKPYSSIKYMTKVLQVDISEFESYDSDYILDGTNFVSHKRHMKLKLVETFENQFLPYSTLKEVGLKSVQGPSKVRGRLAEFIANKTSQIDERKLEQELIYDVDIMLQDNTTKPVIYNPEPKEKSALNIENVRKKYSRDRKIAINALNRANHKCEIDNGHPSFLRKKTLTNYTEPHHLIPIAFQDDFENSLDVEANIVALCSNCHNHIHYGTEAEELIYTLYEKRKDELEDAGIEISVSKLLELYQ